jgi:AAA+ superfamily predicted ATPase
MSNLSIHKNTMTVFLYLKELITWRIKNPEGDFKNEAPKLSVTSLEASPLLDFIKKHRLNNEEFIAVLLSLIPHIRPDFIVDIITEEFPSGTDFPLFGGAKGKNHRGILPTGETLLYLLGGIDNHSRIEFFHLFSEDNTLSKLQILHLEKVPQGEPLFSGKLILSEEILHLITTGNIPNPKLSTEFPAEKLETLLSWEDLVLHSKTQEQIKELEIWLKHNNKLMETWGMKNRLKPGYRALFFGPPGTGKTLTASLLGKYTQKPVYRIDLSTVVSKYIGETEKNLSNLFNKAANKDWILFFDEADAIFGKRTNVRDAHDKYANQEVSYLLQRVENHPGLVILASNFKDNIDEAFTRRFQSIIEFTLPGVAERKLIWEKNLPVQLKLNEDVDLLLISKKYEISGSNIVNIIQYCCLQLLHQNRDFITQSDLIKGIKREYSKENRLF